MQVVINGQEREIEPGTTLAALVTGLALQPRHVAVEVNRELVPRTDYQATPLKPGDRIEIVTLVGGG